MRALRLVMMGTGSFAVPTLEALYESPHSVAVVVTRPLRAAAGRRAPPPNPLRVAAGRRAIPLFDPPDVNSPEARSALAATAPDLLVVADFGQILSDATLGLAPLGGINLHGSLLPKFRGAAPVAWAIYHGETKSGVSVIHMTAGLDAGPCLAQRAVDIDPEETAGQLEARLARAGAALVVEVVDQLALGTAREVPQDPAQATTARRLRKSDGLLDWRRAAAALKNQVRAMQPWPLAYTFWLRESGTAVRLIVHEVAVADRTQPAEPGAILEARGERFVVACGEGSLLIGRLQPEGKRPQTAAEFLRGHPLRCGQRLGTPA